MFSLTKIVCSYQKKKKKKCEALSSLLLETRIFGPTLARPLSPRPYPFFRSELVQRRSCSRRSAALCAPRRGPAGRRRATRTGSLNSGQNRTVALAFSGRGKSGNSACQGRHKGRVLAVTLGGSPHSPTFRRLRASAGHADLRWCPHSQRLL